MTTVYDKQLEKITNAGGFIAALDQSGGSSPKALRLYGVPDDSYVEGEESMYDAIHAMRTRITTSPSFTGERILAAILFEATMNRDIKGKPSATYLWEEKGVVPLVKVDQGLMEEKDGVQLMKPLTKLDALLDVSKGKGIFGTKMRSVIKLANKDGIKAIVEQQFAVAKKILDKGLHPIIEPEVDINSAEKSEAEAMLKDSILESLNKLTDEKVMLKLSLPSIDNFYKELADHKNVMRVVALSGGYPREEANTILAKNEKVIGSFSRALTEGLALGDTDAEFDKKLDAAVSSIHAASTSN